MGKLKIWLAILFCTFTLCTNAQDTAVANFQLSGKITGHFSKFYVDNLGNIYTLSIHQSRIVKYNNRGDSVRSFDNLMRYGNITSLDVSNPLKLLVYYKNFSKIVVIDRFFNIINTIDLRKSGIMQASIIASSYDNNVWVYDQQAAKIKKVDAQGNVLFSSNDLRAVFSNAPSPIYMKDENGTLFLYDKVLGWLLFDYYGSLKKKWSYQNWQNVFVDNGAMLGVQSNRLWVFSKNLFEATAVTVPSFIDIANSRQLLIHTNKWYLLNKEGIAIFLRQAK